MPICFDGGRERKEETPEGLPRRSVGGTRDVPTTVCAGGRGEGKEEKENEMRGAWKRGAEAPDRRGLGYCVDQNRGKT